VWQWNSERPAIKARYAEWQIGGTPEIRAITSDARRRVMLVRVAS